MAMSYEDFLDIAKDAAKTHHPEADVTIQKVEKLQEESYVGGALRTSQRTERGRDHEPA